MLKVHSESSYNLSLSPTSFASASRKVEVVAAATEVRTCTNFFSGPVSSIKREREKYTTALEVHKRLDHDYDDDGFWATGALSLESNKRREQVFVPFKRKRHPLLSLLSHPLVFSSSSSSLSWRISFLFLEEEVISSDSPTDTLPFSSFFSWGRLFLSVLCSSRSSITSKITLEAHSKSTGHEVWLRSVCLSCVWVKQGTVSQIMTCLRLDITLNLTPYLFASSSLLFFRMQMTLLVMEEARSPLR